MDVWNVKLYARLQKGSAVCRACTSRPVRFTSGSCQTHEPWRQMVTLGQHPLWLLPQARSQTRRGGVRAGQAGEAALHRPGRQGGHERDADRVWRGLRGAPAVRGRCQARQAVAAQAPDLLAVPQRQDEGARSPATLAAATPHCSHARKRR